MFITLTIIVLNILLGKIYSYSHSYIIIHNQFDVNVYLFKKIEPIQNNQDDIITE